MDGEFIPHVRMIETGKQSNSLASQFGMPYVLTAEPRSYDEGNAQLQLADARHGGFLGIFGSYRHHQW